MTTTTIPSLKNVTLTAEDTYRKEQMITYLKSRGMLDEASESFIRQGTR